MIYEKRGKLKKCHVVINCLKLANEKLCKGMLLSNKALNEVHHRMLIVVHLLKKYWYKWAQVGSLTTKNSFGLTPSK